MVPGKDRVFWLRGGGTSATARCDSTDYGLTQDPGIAPSSGGKDKGGGTSKDPAADALVATADVPVGGGVILGTRNVVVTQPTKGEFEGFSATCTHQGCILASVGSGTINCGCHGSQFSITDGSNVTGPSGSVAALPKVTVRVKGANVVPG